MTFECSLDGATFVDCTSPGDLRRPRSSPRTRSRCRPPTVVGLTDATAALYEWAVVLPPDTTPPIAQVVSGPPATTTATQATFTFSANEPAVTYECAVDGGDFGSCDEPVRDHRRRAGRPLPRRAGDRRAPATSARRRRSGTWTVDGPADTTITSGPLDETHDTTATFEFTANEAGVTFQCSLDGGRLRAVHVTR